MEGGAYGQKAWGSQARRALSTIAGNDPADATLPHVARLGRRMAGTLEMDPENKSFQTGVSDQAFDTLKRRLVDLVEPLSDAQLLELADGIHDMLRQRRTVRQHHAERMNERARHALDLRI